MTFIDLHNLNIVVMFFLHKHKPLKTLLFAAIIFKIDCILTKILTIMYTYSNLCGNTINTPPFLKIAHKYFLIPQFHCTHYLVLFYNVHTIIPDSQTLVTFSIERNQIFKFVLLDYLQVTLCHSVTNRSKFSPCKHPKRLPSFFQIKVIK